MKLTFTNAREKSRAVIAPTFDSFIFQADKIYDNPHARKILQRMDDYAAVILADTNAPALSFSMNQEDAMRLVHETNAVFHEDDIAFYAAQYNAASSNGTAYSLYIAVDQDVFEKKEPEANGLLCRQKPNGDFEYYDRKSRLWSSDGKKQAIHDLSMGENAELDFSKMLEYYTGLPLMLIRPSIAIQKIQESTELIKLANRLQGLGRFQMVIVSPHGTDYEEEEAFPVLRAPDMDRMGTAVYFRDGKFRICQMVEIEQNTDPMVLYDQTKAETKESFFTEVDSVKDPEAVCRLLNSMWDKSCRGEKWMTIPISKRAFINYEYGLDPDYTVYFSDGKEVLTENEEWALKKLRSAMAKAV